MTPPSPRRVPGDPLTEEERIERAEREVIRLTGSGPGGQRDRNFRMTVPAEPDRDSDLVLMDGLAVGRELLAARAVRLPATPEDAPSPPFEIWAHDDHPHEEPWCGPCVRFGSQHPDPDIWIRKDALRAWTSTTGSTEAATTSAAPETMTTTTSADLSNEPVRAATPEPEVVRQARAERDALAEDDVALLDEVVRLREAFIAGARTGLVPGMTVQDHDAYIERNADAYLAALGGHESTEPPRPTYTEGERLDRPGNRADGVRAAEPPRPEPLARGVKHDPAECEDCRRIVEGVVAEQPHGEQS